MSKQLKERVQIGTSTYGKAVYKWATGGNNQVLLVNIVGRTPQLERV